MDITDIRLSAAGNMADACDILADIGSDHGYLPVSLLCCGKIKRAIITDINKGPLENSKRTAQRYNVAEKCDFYLGDGLYPIKGLEFDSVCVCGMGGELIAKIISDNSEVARRAKFLVLQPMSAQETLAKFLCENGFQITDETFVKDKHLFYRIIKAYYSGNNNKIYTDDFDYEFPPMLIEKKDPVMLEYLKFREKNEKKILDKITAGNSAHGIEHVKATISAIENRLVKF